MQERKGIIFHDGKEEEIIIIDNGEGYISIDRDFPNHDKVEIEYQLDK